ncbi:MAG TPA: Hpt domain-containing protein [Opitutaceae bacterium]|nr:Hpt domain-containing protein [Opitutaceae bacterium]
MPFSNSSPVDPESLQSLRDITPGDPGFLNEIITLFLEDTPARIAEISDCLAKGDGPTLTRAAHSLKGSSSNFGAEAFRLLAEKIEGMGKQGDFASIPPALEELKAEYERVKAALQEELKKP